MLWLLSMPACGEVHKALNEVTGLTSTDEEVVHKDLSQARIKRDSKDLQTSLLWLLSMPACGKVHKALKEVTGLTSTDEEVVHKDLSQARIKREPKDLQTSLLWLLSMPACGEVHKALKKMTGLTSTDEEVVHKDLSQARIKRDPNDLQTVMSYLEERKPSARNSKELHSLSSGIIGEGSVNVDSARAVGDSIIDFRVGKSVSQHKFVKKQQVSNRASSVYAAFEGQKIEINPHLYQGLLVAGIGNIELKELFQN